eukprot:6187687-Pleurochrysis_carterae.AAC.2
MVDELSGTELEIADATRTLHARLEPLRKSDATRPPQIVTSASGCTSVSKSRSQLTQGCSSMPVVTAAASGIGGDHAPNVSSPLRDRARVASFVQTSEFTGQVRLSTAETERACSRTHLQRKHKIHNFVQFDALASQAQTYSIHEHT